MTERAAEQPAWLVAGHQKALALLRLGPSGEAIHDQYELISLTADEDGAQLVGLVLSLVGMVEQMALAQLGDRQAWNAWLDAQIAETALQQTEG